MMAQEPRTRGAEPQPENIGELADADAVGTVANAACGEMLRMWIKFKDDQGQRVIDRATFQSFGCETAIAVASLATQLIRGKTPAEALAMKTEQLACELGPLPPMKIHCAELVEAALRDALDNQKETPTSLPNAAVGPATANSNLLDTFLPPQPEGRRLNIVLLP